MSKQVNTDYLIKLFTERSYAVSRDGIDALNLGMTLSDMIQVISEASGVVYATASQKQVPFPSWLRSHKYSRPDSNRQYVH